MSVGRRSWWWVTAVGLTAIGAFYLAGRHSGTFRMPGTPQESNWQRRYWEAVFQAERADEAQNWAQAAWQYGQLITLLPHAPEHRYNRAAALAHLGRDEESLEELRWAIEFGWADIEGLQSDPVFSRIRGTTGFRKLLDRAAQITDEPIALYIPQGLNPKTPAPLVIAFHGLGENPHGHIRSWHNAADRLSLVVVAPRGIARFGAQRGVRSFRWVTARTHQRRDDIIRCKDMLRQSIEFARGRANIDERRILLAGYSEGGSVALALLGDPRERFCGAVVEATAFSPRTLKAWQRPPSERRVRVCVIVHEFDRMRPAGEEAYRLLKDAGIDARLMVVPGADHELPMDGGARQIEAVGFVLALDSSGP